MNMKEFYIRTARVWVKVMRNTKTREFSFAIGYAGQVKAFNVRTYDRAYPSTVKEAREFATSMTTDYV